MELTAYQQQMLDGAYGKGKAMALQILVAVGESFDAQRLVPISRAHVSLSAQEADIWFAEKLQRAGAVCAVPPTVNPGYSLAYFGSRISSEAVANMEAAHRIYGELGAVLTYSCTPYLADNIPRYGETVAFSETSATIYVNSVLGARTNRESAASALCAAVTGFVPEYGMLLAENRRADVVVEVRDSLHGEHDFSLLGLMGKMIGKGVPVFTGLPRNTGVEALINLGTQLNVSGSCDLFHAVGITPGADTLEQALGGGEPKRHVVLTRDDLHQEAERFSPPLDGPPEFVILGCPHYTYPQAVRAADILAGRRTRIPVWILTSGTVQALARRTGLEQRLLEGGVELVTDTCVDQACCWGHLAGKPGVTDSPKCTYYMGAFGVQATVKPMEDCLRMACEEGVG